MTEAEIKFIVMRIVQHALDSFSDAHPTDDFSKGQRLAFYAVLDTVKSELLVRDEDLSEYGLDFDLEKFLA